MSMLFAEPLATPNVVAGMLIPRVTDAESMQQIRRLERPPLHRYVLAKDLFVSVLKGRSLDWAISQANKSSLKHQQKHADALLRTCAGFLTEHQGTFESDIPKAFWTAGGQMKLARPNGVILHGKTGPEIVLFHFWRVELPVDRLGVIKAALRGALWSTPRLTGMPIKLITAPFVEPLKRRAIHSIICDSQCASEIELENFGARLGDLWTRYHELHPFRSWP